MSDKFEGMYYLVRVNIAKQGRGEDLDILVNDEHWDVRRAVAEQGRDKDLDILVNDEDSDVRYAVAKHGRDKDLDILVNDEDGDVRRAVAKQGRGEDLDILVNDEHWDVRCAVAEQGRDKDLDILVNDKNFHVRCAVERQGREKDLDTLVNDENFWVRCTVAKQGRDKDLDILVNDEDGDVRRAVAEHGRDKDLDILVNDEDRYVRYAVAEHGRDKDLDILVNDEDRDVRVAVASNGYGLDILRDDTTYDVHNAVRKYLDRQGYFSVDEWAAANPEKCCAGKVRAENKAHANTYPLPHSFKREKPRGDLSKTEYTWIDERNDTRIAISEIESRLWCSEVHMNGVTSAAYSESAAEAYETAYKIFDIECKHMGLGSAVLEAAHTGRVEPAGIKEIAEQAASVFKGASDRADGFAPTRVPNPLKPNAEASISNKKR